MPDNCLFCRIISGEIPAKMVAQDDQVVAFHDINPQAPIHVLIVPRQHISSVDAIGPEHGTLLVRMFGVAQNVARANRVDQRGYRLVFNHGPDAGQSVDHLHMHLLAGRKLAWPPG